jgi:hypothetical protein
MNERGLVNSSPDPEEIRPLCGPFINRWAAYLQSDCGPEALAERQKAMEETFRKLIELAELASGGSFSHRIDLILDKKSEPKSDKD